MLTSVFVSCATNRGVAVLAILCFLQLNCKKEVVYSAKINTTEKFFELPNDANPVIKRIVEDLKKKNAAHPFVEEFVKKEGFPVWKYAKITTHRYETTNIITTGEGDTLVSVPVVKEGTEYVKDGTPINPNATGGFKNNGDPIHEYNAAVNAYNVSASQFSMVMNNLLSHENDTYNIFDNNCTTLALNAFNLLITPPISCEIFVVNTGVPPAVNILYFMESPQKLYKALETFQPGSGLNKEFNVNYDSPFSTIICP